MYSRAASSSGTSYFLLKSKCRLWPYRFFSRLEELSGFWKTCHKGKLKKQNMISIYKHSHLFKMTQSPLVAFSHSSAAWSTPLAAAADLTGTERGTRWWKTSTKNWDQWSLQRSQCSPSLSCWWSCGSPGHQASFQAGRMCCSLLTMSRESAASDLPVCLCCWCDLVVQRSRQSRGFSFWILSSYADCFLKIIKLMTEVFCLWTSQISRKPAG